MHLNPRTRLILAAIGLACSAPALATVQVPEVVLINGTVYYLPMWGIYGNVLPLEALWRNPRDKLGLALTNTGCWRSYVGIWEIHDDTLYLRALDAWHDRQTDEKADMKAIFPERFTDGKVKADWFSGKLTLHEHAFSFFDGESFELPFSQGKVKAPATARHIGANPEEEDRSSTGDREPSFVAEDAKRRRIWGVQWPDTFLFDGIVYYLPVELSKQLLSAEQLWRDPSNRPTLSANNDGNAGGWLARGYKAVWEVHDGSLYMLALDAWLGGRKAGLSQLSPERFRNGRIKADWFSGELNLITFERASIFAAGESHDPPLDAPKVALRFEHGRLISVTQPERIVNWRGTRGIAGSYTNDEGIEENRDVVAFVDFESEDWRKDWSGGHLATAGAVSEDAERGFEPLLGKALRIKVGKGGHYGASFQYRFKGRTGSEPEEIYFRYYLRLGSDWDPARGGKLPGIGGTYGRAGWGGRPSNGRNGWSARGQFNGRKDGKTPIGFYCYHADMKGRYGSSWIWDKDGLGYLENNRWYCIEQRVRLNTPGKNDGFLEGWVDAKLAFRKTDVRMRDVPDLKIECIWINIYHGGTWSAESDDHLYIDNVVIAKRNIGPMEPPAEDN